VLTGAGGGEATKVVVGCTGAGEGGTGAGGGGGVGFGAFRGGRAFCLGFVTGGGSGVGSVVVAGVEGAPVMLRGMPGA
jgi:hypothetical protein